MHEYATRYRNSQFVSSHPVAVDAGKVSAARTIAVEVEISGLPDAEESVCSVIKPGESGH